MTLGDPCANRAIPQEPLSVQPAYSRVTAMGQKASACILMPV